MEIKMKKVYYCSYCKKHSLKSLKNHEWHCTLNPLRECGVCGLKAGHLETIINRLRKYTFPLTMEDIRKEEENNCPVCILAIIRLMNLNKFPYSLDFNFKEELDKWWANKNEIEREADELSQEIH